jgi:hypothetical protein
MINLLFLVPAETGRAFSDERISTVTLGDMTGFKHNYRNLSPSALLIPSLSPLMKGMI